MRKTIAALKSLVLDSFVLSEPKGSTLVKLFNNFQVNSYFIVDGNNQMNSNFSLAVENIPNVTSVSQIGTNVYDVVRCDYVLLLQEAVESLEKRLR